jgi:hypothetical protein
MSTEPDYKALYEQSQLRLLALEQQLAQLQKMIFGSKQERFIPADLSSPQLSLDIQSEPVATAMITASKPVSYIRHTLAVEAKPLQHPGRMKLPERLRREQIIIEPSVDTTDCKKIGEEIMYETTGIKRPTEVITMLVNTVLRRPILPINNAVGMDNSTNHMYIIISTRLERVSLN